MKKAVKRGRWMACILLLCILVVFHQQVTEEISREISWDRAKKAEVIGNLVSLPLEKKTEYRKTAYLTFDDGPSANTDRILDLLKEKNVKATFFVVGKEGEKARERYRRIVEEGHSLGMHSYSHQYDEIYASLDHFKEDLHKIQDYLYEVTGEKIMIYRFPGGSSNSVARVSMEECISYLEEQGIEYYDWNASSEDAVLLDAECAVLNRNILKDALSYKNSMILMHDLFTCPQTVEGLPELVDRLLEEGYELKAIDENTVPVHHR